MTASMYYSSPRQDLADFPINEAIRSPFFDFFDFRFDFDRLENWLGGTRTQALTPPYSISAEKILRVAAGAVAAGPKGSKEFDRPTPVSAPDRAAKR
jgi:hypothetical protein